MDDNLKHIVLVLFLALNTIVLSAQAPVALTLDEAIEYAWQNSNEMKNAQLNIRDAEERIIENRAAGIPQLTAGADYTRYFQRPLVQLPESFFPPDQPVSDEDREVSFVLQNNFNANLNLDALIFDGTYITALKAAKKYRKYVEEDLRVKRRTVRNQVIDAYLPVLLIDKNLEILQSNLSNVQKLRDETAALYQEGFAEQLDVDRLDLSLANLKVEQENLDRRREIALNLLKFALNVPEGEDIRLTEDLEKIGFDLADEDLTGQINTAARPEVQYANAGIELSDLNIQVNKMGYLPTLSGFAGYTAAFQGNDEEGGFWAPTGLFGFRLNVPIFDGWDKKAKIQRARISKEISLNQLDDLERSIRLEVNNGRKAYQTAKESLAAQERNLQLAERIYNTTQIKYREGVGSSLEVNQAEQSLYNSQANYIQALYDLTLARIELRKALGK